MYCIVGNVAAVERIWHINDSQGQIMALASGLGFKSKVLHTF